MDIQQTCFECFEIKNVFIYLCIYFFFPQLALLGIDILSTLVTRLQDRFRTQIGTGKIILSGFIYTHLFLCLYIYAFFLLLKKVYFWIYEYIRSTLQMGLCPVIFVFLSVSVLPSLIDRLGDAKDQVRDQDQTLLLKIMDQAANPQVVLH